MYELNKIAFGSFLAQLRREKGMTQKELAACLYVSDKAVSKWERGLSVPDISLLVPLAEQLNVTVAELLHGCRVEEEQRFTREETEELIRKAGEERQKTARISLNWPQAVIHFSYVENAGIPEPEVVMEDANEGEQFDTGE